MDVIERFWAKVDKTGECWVWTGNTKGGYGQFYLDGKNHRSHRISYTWENGPIPEGLVIDHMCSNPPCVRPSHLRAVTQRENLLAAKETVMVKMLSKTHCDRGHELAGENLRIDRDGYRICRACQTIRARIKNAKSLREYKTLDCPACGKTLRPASMKYHRESACPLAGSLVRGSDDEA